MAFPSGWTYYKTRDIKRASGALSNWQARLVIAAEGSSDVVSSELVTGGDFESTSGWSAYQGTIASVSGGQSGNCCQLTQTSGEYSKVERTITLVKGQRYRLTGYIKSGTSGDESYEIGVRNNDYVYDAKITGTTSGEWVQVSQDFDFAHDVSPIYIRFQKNTGTSGTMLFDEISVKKIANITLEGHGKTDFSDLRFSNTSDGALDYFIDHVDGTTPNQVAYVDVEIDSVATSDTLVKCWYGNSSATSESSAANTFIIYDDFERGNDGDAVGGDWTVTQGTLEIDTAQKYAGTRSMRLAGGATTPQCTIPLTAANKEYEIKYRIRKTSNAGTFYLFHGNGTNLINVSIDVNENLKYTNTAESLIDTGINVSYDAWHELAIDNIDFDNNAFDLYLDGSLVGSALQMRSKSWFSSVIGLQSSATTANDDFWIDNFVVRNWRSTPPEWQGDGWSAEQLAATGINDDDAGTGVDSSTLAADIAGTDSGAGAESSDLYAPSLMQDLDASDSGVGVDIAYFEFNDSDSGAGTDAGIIIDIASADTGAGVDAAAQSYDIVSSDSGSIDREYAEHFSHFATASIAAFSLGGYLPTGSEGTDWPDEFQLWEADGYLGDPLIAEGLMSLTESYTHVTATVSPAAVSASVNTCYLEDYYYRIHVVPSYIDLGQLLSAETREITVWNAYFTPQIMTSVTEVSTDGIEISEPVTIPYEFAPLEEVTYDADVGTSGPSTIGATVYFNFAALFPDSTLYCMIVGSRVMVWVWLPREAYTEEMCWRTDVLQTRNGEQRIAYLDAPRQTYKYEFSLPADQYSNLKVPVDKQAHGVWGLPI